MSADICPSTGEYCEARALCVVAAARLEKLVAGCQRNVEWERRLPDLALVNFLSRLFSTQSGTVEDTLRAAQAHHRLVSAAAIVQCNGDGSLQQCLAAQQIGMIEAPEEDK